VNNILLLLAEGEMEFWWLELDILSAVLLFRQDSWRNGYAVDSKCAHQPRPPLGRLQPPSSVGNPPRILRIHSAMKTSVSAAPTHHGGRFNRSEIRNLTIGFQE
jgi:hypothetical protein